MRFRIRSSLAMTGRIVAFAAAMVFSGIARAQDFELAHEFTLQSITSSTGVGWAAADFDRDGDIDLAIILTDGSVLTASNDGTGAFSIPPATVKAPRPKLTGLGYTQVLAGDFDNDGALDLLISTLEYEPSSAAAPCLATLFRNHGDGTFAPGQSFAAVPFTAGDTVPSCTALDVGDYDADGMLDFVLVAKAQSSSWSDVGYGVFDVFRGNGDGTFAAPTVTKLTDGGPYLGSALASGDFDADGVRDLAFGEDVLDASAPVAHQVEIFSGDGTGQFFSTFAETVPNLGATKFTQARAYDVTGDGRLDLVLASSATASSAPVSAPVLLFSNTGDGALSAAATVSGDVDAVGLEIADFDYDARPDLMLVSKWDRVTLASGDGHGAFSTSAIFATGGELMASVAADFDADGHTDLAVLDATRPTFRVAHAERTGLGLPLPLVTSLTSALGEMIWVPADVDQDGVVDLVTSSNSDFDVLLGRGNGQFDLATHITGNGGQAPLQVGDMNGDGLPDLVVPAPGHGFQTLLGSEDGTFGGRTSVDLGDREVFVLEALGDYDEDGDLDLAGFHEEGVSPYPASVRLYLNDGSGNFSLDQEFPLSIIASRLIFADLNGDRHPDLFIGSSLNKLHETYPPSAPPGDSLTLLGDGIGGFTPVTAITLDSEQYELADLNGDDRLDLVTNEVVALGNGDGSFGPYVIVSQSSKVALGDFDGDGKLDLATTYVGSIGLKRGNGDGTFAPTEPLFYGVPDDWQTGEIGVGEFNGDGKLDLLIERLPDHRLPSIDSIPELVTILTVPPPPPPPPPVTCGSHGPSPHRDWPPWFHHAWPKWHFGKH